MNQLMKESFVVTFWSVKGFQLWHVDVIKQRIVIRFLLLELDLGFQWHLFNKIITLLNRIIHPCSNRNSFSRDSVALRNIEYHVVTEKGNLLCLSAVFISDIFPVPKNN